VVSKATVKTNGIILHAYPIFEKDRLIEVLTAEDGKLKLLVKSGQKKWAGHIQIGHFIEASVYQRSSIPLITECHVKDAFAGIRTHFNRLSMMGYILSMARLATAFHQPNASLFYLVKDTLAQLACPTTPISKSQEALQFQSKLETYFLKCEGIMENDKPFHTQFYEYAGRSLAAPIVIE
jgi:DNA repair protein RecO